jgi:site-specific recombinase XerD
MLLKSLGISSTGLIQPQISSIFVPQNVLQTVLQMAVMKRLNQYLKCRGDRWVYHRRVPSAFQELDPRGTIRTSLGTSSLEIARARRDALASADERLWRSLRQGQPTALDSYEAARERAMARGFIYIPAEELAVEATLDEILDRLKKIDTTASVATAEADAVLGLVEPTAVKMSEAFDIYCTKICAVDLKGKSENQIKNWTKVKRRAVNNFTAICGDLPMNEIERSHGKLVFDWWSRRVNPTDGSKPLHANSANKDFTNLRILFEKFWSYQGDETRENPFRNLRFKNVVYKDIPPFSPDWIESKVLEPHTFDSLNDEARCIIYALIETGCRPSEIANLQPEHIVLDHEIPHLQIRPTAKRQLKSKSANRDIPLLGVSLQAMRQFPNGFPRYREKANSLSATLSKAFRSKDLFPTEDHRIYSFRHSFEKRMLEAGLDYGLRCKLIGHYNNRPDYGDGGSLAFRRDELSKIIFDDAHLTL